MAEDENEPGFDYRRIDDVIHSRVRLALMAFLASAGASEFTAVRKHLKVSDGNLSVHVRKLEEAGYLRVDKSFVARRPQTMLTLSEAGRAALLDYLDHLKGLIDPIDDKLRH